MTEDVSAAARTVTIRRWADLQDRAASLPGLDHVFFSSSATQSFASDEARAAFRWRWLGRYLDGHPSLVHVALAPSSEIVGYVCGTLDDPALSGRFDDIGYFASIAHLTRRYPAQLHVNLAPAHRGHGLGARLVGAFCADACAAGVPGVHVVTGRGMRNVEFYLRNRFTEAGAFDWNGRVLLFLGRALDPA